MKRRLIWLAALVATVLLAVIVYDSTGFTWVGHTDLRIQFVVVDARTGQGIKGARIQVKQREGGFCADRTAQEFELLTDESGMTSRICEGCMSFGTQSGLKFTDTYSAHTPRWQARITAKGYRESEEIDIEGNPVYRRHIRRVGTGAAEMVVRVALSPN
ncbi:MAG: hypothetical protein JSS02_31730 [Planctomycetes bacterium]|nr:hypothetical protein [Planctomycetota bacterium]